MKRQLALCIGILAMGITATAQSATVAVIEIRTEIGKGLSRYIERSIAAAAEQDADAIVFDMHTPGGRVDAMGEIVNHIFDTDLPTIAYVRTEAISAGAVIALACDQIVM
ncbi:MAG: ATP-dependent Clp protease proteolytic subunit, partial [Candidatus Poribacteria bacterium]|nr:ATP-dependent Clp protease proteolytic subunit [Candidatus Poribacteria bacterium]